MAGGVGVPAIGGDGKNHRGEGRDQRDEDDDAGGDFCDWPGIENARLDGDVDIDRRGVSADG